MAEWRYIAQRVSTGEFLHGDLPLKRDELRWDLSAPGSLRASCTPELGGLTAADGGLVLDEWGTYLYAEKDGVIEWGGIVMHSAFSGATWSVEAAGFSTYPTGIPYDGVYSKLNLDPLDAVREIWRHVQAHTDGDLDMIIDDTTSPIRLGTAALPAYDEVFIDGDWVLKSTVDPADIDPATSSPLNTKITATATSLTLKRIEGFGTITAFPYNVTIEAETITVAGRSGNTLTGLTRGASSTIAKPHALGTSVHYRGTPQRTFPEVPAQPYKLVWWESPDCGDEITQLVGETPFDFTERHQWSGSTITHHLDIGYPLIGTTRTDLAFVQGDNIVKVTEVDRDGDEFANEVIGLGAGEGSAAIRARVKDIDGHLRRPKVRTEKGISDKNRLTTMVTRELAARQNIESTIDSIVVRDHPNARIGSWSLGDDILVQAELPWLGEVSLWCRIESWALNTDSEATIYLTKNSNSPQSRLARELAAINHRLKPLERTPQLYYSSMDPSGNNYDGVTPPVDGYDPTDPYLPPDSTNLSDLPTKGDLADVNTKLGEVGEAIDTLADGTTTGGGGGSGSGNMVALYKGTDGIWPARGTFATTVTVEWIGAWPPPDITAGSVLVAWPGDLYLETD